MASSSGQEVRCNIGLCLAAGASLTVLAVFGPARSALAAPAQAPAVTFTDIALEIGFQDRLSHGRALVAADFNNDGLIDFYLGNPGDPLVADDESFILWNDGPDKSGQYRFHKGQVLIKGDIAFTAAAIDYDNDGDQDLFIGIGGQEGIGLDHLFRNHGGVFTDVSENAGIRGPKDSRGNWVPTATSSGTWVDYDNDGDLDLFVASRYVVESLILPGGLGWRNSLFRNDGDGTFTDVTAAAGVGGTASSMTAAWGDFDNDGWMDLYVPTGYGPGEGHPAGFELYRNMHDGTFRKTPIKPSDVQFGTKANWASGTADFNNDGWLDIISWARGVEGLVGDSHALLINHGHWSFTNEAISSGLALPGAPTPRVMGCQAGDLNNDGYLDAVIANGGPDHGNTDNLFLNTYTPQTGLRFEDVSSLIDYPAPPDPLCESPPVDPRNLFVNQGDLIDADTMMTKALPAKGASDDCGSSMRRPLDQTMDLCNPPYPYRGHGVVFLDLDRDGDLDLFMSKGGTRITADSVEPNRAFRNDGGNAKNWLFVTLTGVVSNRDGIGSRIEVVSSKAGGDPRQIFREVQGGANFSADGPREIHFGLGDDDTVEQVRISWPSGIRTVVTNPGVNKRLRLIESVLLTSKFNDGQANGWTPVSGVWSVADNEYLQTGGGRAISVNATASRTDFTVVGKATYLSGTEQMGLLARTSTDGKDWYGVVLLGTKAQIYKSVGGSLAALGSPMAIDPMTPGKSYIVSLRCQGASLRWMVDGNEGPPVTDTSIASGSIGVTTNNTSASFDNIAVY